VENLTVEMEDVESPLDEAGTVRESKVSIEYPKVAPKTAGLAGQHIEEKQAPDVVIRPSPKEHARIQQLEKENQELRNNTKQLYDQLSGAQRIPVPEHEANLVAEKSQSASSVSKLGADFAKEKPQAAHRTWELESSLAEERSQADEMNTKLQTDLAKEKANSSKISKHQNINLKLDNDCRTGDQKRRQIEQKNKSLYSQLDQKERNIQNLQDLYRHEKQERELRDREVRSLREQCQALENERNDYYADYINVDKALKVQKQETATLQKRVEYLLEESQKKSSEIKELRAHIEQQEVSVTKAQNAAMNVLSQSLSAALPDDRIRTRFKDLFESIAEWARDNATQDRTILDSQENMAKWEKAGLLRRVGEAGAKPNLEFDMEDETTIDTLLNAALARCICQDFLKNPFWFAEDSSPIAGVDFPSAERITTDVALERLLEKMMKC
jgi:hypothetical protein